MSSWKPSQPAADVCHERRESHPVLVLPFKKQLKSRSVFFQLDPTLAFAIVSETSSLRNVLCAP